MFEPLTVNIFLTRRCGESSLKILPLIRVSPGFDWAEEPELEIEHIWGTQPFLGDGRNNIMS